MPRTPAVFDRKIKWRRLDDSFFATECEQHASAVNAAEAFQRQLKEEELLGMLTEVSDAEAKRLYPGNRLSIASLGAN